MGYYNVATIDSATSNLAQNYPTLATVITLPDTSVENRTCKAVRISTTPGAPKDTVLIIAGVHGSEWGSCEIALNLAVDLLEAYSGGSGLGYGGKVFRAREIRRLLDQRDIVVFPLVNPDGRFCSQEIPGREMWRKNRNTAESGRDPERVGVDINRNFDFLFDLSAFAPGSGVSGSTDPGEGFYQGPDAFSEPETRNVRWLLDNLPNTGWFIDIHCTGPTIGYVWNDDEAQQSTPSMNFRNSQFDGQRGMPGPGYREFLAAGDLARMQELSQRFVDDLQAVQGTRYAAGPAFQVAPLPGTSHDYAYARHLNDSSKGKVLGFVVEWGNFIHPDWPDMEEVIKEVTAGLIGFCIETQAR